ncbi:hypothetical protein, partial [Ideonella azotifigens]
MTPMTLGWQGSPCGIPYLMVRAVIFIAFWAVGIAHAIAPTDCRSANGPRACLYAQSSEVTGFVSKSGYNVYMFSAYDGFTAGWGMTWPWFQGGDTPEVTIQAYIDADALANPAACSALMVDTPGTLAGGWGGNQADTSQMYSYDIQHFGLKRTCTNSFPVDVVRYWVCPWASGMEMSSGIGQRVCACPAGKILWQGVCISERDVWHDKPASCPGKKASLFGVGDPIYPLIGSSSYDV